MLASHSSNPASGRASANNPPSPTSSYNSKSDEDFNPNSAYGASSASSSDAESTSFASLGIEDAGKLAELPTPLARTTATIKPVLKRKRGRPPRKREGDQSAKPDAAIATEGPAELKEHKSEKNKTKKSGQGDGEEAGNLGGLDSGDEATIRERAQKVKKRKTLSSDGKAGGVVRDGSSGDDSVDDYDDDEGGIGGWVKTRSQRRAEHTERKPVQTTQGSTIDVDAIWANIASAPIGRTDLTNHRPVTPVNHDYTEVTPKKSSKNKTTNTNATDGTLREDKNGASKNNIVDDSKQDDKDNETITIKRTYRFAGETITETRVVSKHSAEAQLYLSSTNTKKHTSQTHPSAACHADDDDDDNQTHPTENNDETGTSNTTHAQPTSAALLKLLPPPPSRRPSRFDPNPTGHVPGLPEEVVQLTWHDRYKISNNRNSNTADDDTDPAATATAIAIATIKTANANAKVKAPAAEQPVKLTTITKSALDWAQHVDTVEGLRDELDKYGKGKEDYLGKVEFLREVEGRRFVDGRG